MAEEMTEEEYEAYMLAVYKLQDNEPKEYNPYEQLRDEDGYRVEGCYRTNPAPTE